MQTDGMSPADIFRGERVRLAMEAPKIIGELFSRWGRDSEYWRLLASDPATPRSPKAIQAWVEKFLEKDPPEVYMFMIRALEDDRLIGEIGLDGVQWEHGESFVGLSLGERSDWGKGYGTDAMRVILRYAFTELNLARVSLTVFEYNPRAMRSYEKAGFRYEGRSRQFLRRDGQRYDLLFMGILREEWQAMNA
ncbi:MAG: GNAT family protein [Chloroflexota bacterium]